MAVGDVIDNVSAIMHAFDFWQLGGGAVPTSGAGEAQLELRAPDAVLRRVSVPHVHQDVDRGFDFVIVVSWSPTENQRVWSPLRDVRLSA